jgi:DNA-binding CsgD family transcriptional regulator
MADKKGAVGGPAARVVVDRTKQRRAKAPRAHIGTPAAPRPGWTSTRGALFLAKTERSKAELLAEIEELRRENADLRAQLASRRHYRLTPEQRRIITALLRKGDVSDREIARQAGCSPQTVGDLRRSISSSDK